MGTSSDREYTYGYQFYNETTKRRSPLIQARSKIVGKSERVNVITISVNNKTLG